MDMTFGTWKVRSLRRAASLLSVAGEAVRYKLDIVGVQEVKLKRGSNEPAG
jgi:exonuclease III